MRPSGSVAFLGGQLVLVGDTDHDGVRWRALLASRQSREVLVNGVNEGSKDEWNESFGGRLSWFERATLSDDDRRLDRAKLCRRRPGGGFLSNLPNDCTHVSSDR
jgi:hypothetical protein